MLFLWWQSVFGFRTYHTLKNAKGWQAVLFGVYLLLMGTLVFNVYFGFQLSKQLPGFLASVPEIRLEQGKLTQPARAVTVPVAQTGFDIVLDAQATQPPSYQQFLDKKIMAFVSAGHIYMPSVSGVQSQPIPSQWTLHLTPQLLKEKTSLIGRVIQSLAFFGSVLALGLFLGFSLILAGAVLLLWNGLSQRHLPAAVLWRWAVFLQGPALALWMVNLFFGVPLFIFGLFILFNIYSQQIFNTLPGPQPR